MKKNGFTLAEVLITLAIIGVVATLTLPSLLTNTAEQQAKSAMKKAVNTLTEAAQMSQAIDGYDYASLTSTDTGLGKEESQSLYGILARRTAVDFGKVGAGKQPSSYSKNSSNYTMFLRDGSSISFDAANSTATGTTGSVSADTIQTDGLPFGIGILYDTNGAKGPNMLSNCNSVTTGLKSGSDKTTADAAAACTKTARVIKDQFGLRLRGGFVVPNGAAARWILEN